MNVFFFSFVTSEPFTEPILLIFFYLKAGASPVVPFQLRI